MCLEVRTIPASHGDGAIVSCSKVLTGNNRTYYMDAELTGPWIYSAEPYKEDLEFIGATGVHAYYYSHMYSSRAYAIGVFAYGWTDLASVVMCVDLCNRRHKKYIDECKRILDLARTKRCRAILDSEVFPPRVKNHFRDNYMTIDLGS